MKDKVKILLKSSISPRFHQRLKTVYKRAQFVGSRFKCPFCKSFIKTFLPFGHDFSVLKEYHVVGGGYRLNVRCPVCDSFDRNACCFYTFFIKLIYS